jgi:leucyl-tRNA synthetase
LKDCSWPRYDESLAAFSEVEFVVQVNGKVRAKFVADKTLSREKAVEIAVPLVEKWTAGKTIKKTVFVPGRLISLVVC